MTVDDRTAIGERLSHVHHSLVTGGITVRVKLPDDVSDRTSRFLRFRGRRHSKIAHRIDDASLNRFQPVADVGQCAIKNHVHRVVEVRFLRKSGERDPFDPLEVQFLLFHQLTHTLNGDIPLFRISVFRSL